MNDSNDHKFHHDADWAMIPLDEVADAERWTRLTAETAALAESARSTETLVGAVMMRNELPPVSNKSNPPDSADELYDLLDPF